MKHFHSHIRRDAAILYAKKHADVALKTIAMAFGVSPDKARSTSAMWGKYGKLGRPSGGKSPAYDFATRTKKMRGYYDSKKFNEKEFRALLAEGHDFTEIGKRLNRSPDYLRDIARRNGYKWERHYGGRSDTKVFAYLAEHKNDDLVSLASALGYSDPRNLKNRLTKMRVPIPPMPPRAPGSGRIHVFDHEAIATLLVKGISHKQIAERIKCSLALVSVVARKHGVTRKKKQVTNEDILAYRRKHPKATHSQMAKALGYIFTKSLLSRLKKLGISLSQPKKRTK